MPVMSTKDLADRAARREEAWVWEQRKARLDFDAISIMSGMSVEIGGLGVELSPAECRQRYNAHQARRRVLEQIEDDARRAEELAGMDERQRRHEALAGEWDSTRSSLAAFVLTGKWMTVPEIAAEAPECLVPNDRKVQLAALAGIERVAAERRKLLGLDAPEKHTHEVTVQEAATADLARALAEAGIDMEPAS